MQSQSQQPAIRQVLWSAVRTTCLYICLICEDFRLGVDVHASHVGKTATQVRLSESTCDFVPKVQSASFESEPARRKPHAKDISINDGFIGSY